MTISLAPPPLQVPSDFVVDKEKNGFFSALLNTIYQLWTQVYGIRTTGVVKTTDATQTALLRVLVNDGFTVMLDLAIVARRTGGSAGTDGDSAFYKLTGAYKNVGGVLTGIGTPAVVAGEDQVGWSVDFTNAGGYAIVTVTGAANNNITWSGTLYTYTVGA